MNERIDYLPGKKLHIVQRPDVFSFSMDAVLLAKFATIYNRDQSILDLCAGNGAVALMLSTRTNALIDLLEIQPLLCKMAMKSIELNQLEDRLHVYEGDLTAEETWNARVRKYDVITCNPPYFPLTEEKQQNSNKHLSLARHEVSATFNDVAWVAAAMLKDSGRLAVVHRPERLTELLKALSAHRLEPKRIQFVYPKASKDANMVLIEAVKDGRQGSKLMPPIIVYKEGKERMYTESFQAHYENHVE